MQANKGGKKIDPKKSGLSGVKNDVVRANLMGVSEKMNKKGWTDSQGRKGKVRDGQAYLDVWRTRIVSSTVLRSLATAGVRSLQIR